MKPPIDNQIKPPIDRQRLERMEKEVLRSGSYFEAEVALYTGEADRFVVKDCSCMSIVLRSLVGRRAQKREIGIYRRLDGVEGVPSFLGRIDKDAFAIEFVEGNPMARHLKKERLCGAVTGLVEVLDKIHERRVVHLDLKQKRNVMIRPDGSALIIDFESALHLKPGLLGDFLLNILKKRDMAGLVKFKAKYTPHLLSDREKKIAQKESILRYLWPFKRLARFLRLPFGS